MLAQNFKTAPELGISEIEHEALRTVLGMLERNELVHTAAYRPRAYGFNMGEIFQVDDCGTVACICGWAHLVSGHAAFPQVRRYANNSKRPGWHSLPKDLYRLFFPFEGVLDLSPITPERAAAALRNYLTLGEPHWNEVLA